MHSAGGIYVMLISIVGMITYASKVDGDGKFKVNLWKKYSNQDASGVLSAEKLGGNFKQVMSFMSCISTVVMTKMC